MTFNRTTTAYLLSRRRGSSLLDVIVGVGILSLTFVAIMGLFRMTMLVVTQSKSRAGAVALAGEHMEFMRGLRYDDVGTLGGIPSGAIPQLETIVLNGINYYRRTFIQYIDSPADGEGVLDDNGITTDYKVAKIEIAWNGKNGTSTLATVSTIVPPGLETLEGGGTLTLNVFDALGLPIENAEVAIANDDIIPIVSLTTYTNAQGRVILPGAPQDSHYDIVVTKAGYSTSGTYAPNATNTNPNPPPVTVIEGSTTNVSFQIDRLSQKTVRTFEPMQDALWEDLFDDATRVGLNEGMEVVSGEMVLGNNGSSFNATGSAYTIDIAPDYLAEWRELSVDLTIPPDTELVYRVYRIESGRQLIIDGDLPGNSAGFTASTLDLSTLPAYLYPRIQIGVFASTTNPLVTPRLNSWSIDHAVGPLPLANIPFRMQGTKTMGQDASSQPIYKYDETHQTDGSGSITLNDLEFDTYTITISDSATGYDISEACLPQPLPLPPNVSTTTDFFLVPDSNHTLLVTVYDNTGALLSNATVRVSRTDAPVYDETLTTSTCGQVFFENVPEGTIVLGNDYTLEVTRGGYTPNTNPSIDITGVTYSSVTLFP